jgi:Caspase domain
MTDSQPSPHTKLALLLGASVFSRSPKLAKGRAFYNSAADFRDYLTDLDGLALQDENILWLFDDSRSPSDQLQDIAGFLENRTALLKNAGRPPQDLIVYYVGHGLFSGPEQTYCLAIRTTDDRNEGVTSIRVNDLAAIIKSHARFLRKFLILDCCFSAAAYREFQSGPLQAGRVRLLHELPQKGTALLCSASSQDVSIAPEGLTRTMFSDALMRSLHEGHHALGPQLSLSEVGDLVKSELKEAYPGRWVRPEVHSPDQREGDIAHINVFPNPAFSGERRAPKRPDGAAPASLRATQEVAKVKVEANQMPTLERSASAEASDIDARTVGALEVSQNGDWYRYPSAMPSGWTSRFVFLFKSAIAVGLVLIVVGAAIFWGMSKPKITDEVGSKTSSAMEAPKDAATAAPVAQRAVLYDQDPSNPKGKEFDGTAVWRTEPIEATGSQKPDIAVRVDIDIPDRKFKMTMSFRRNVDTSLPASHTVELTFMLPPDFAGGAVAEVKGILLKSNENARGTPLAGLAVKVTDGFFLMGLSNVDADRASNMQLLKERSWFDVPLVYTDVRRAIIAIEKGAPGERAFKDAFAIWGQ